MKTLYLHIGPPKTGTTSLQHYIYENRSLLLKSGIYTPSEINNFSFFKIFSSKYSQTEPKNLINNLLLNDEMKSNNFSKFLISCEFFSGLNVDEWRLLRNFAENNDLELKIILYIRDLIEITVSSKQENLKKGIGYRDFNIDPPIIQMSYKNLILRLSSLFNSECIVIRPYSYSSSTFSVLEDLIVNVLNLKFYNNRIDINKSLTLRAALILNRINLVDPSIVKKTDLLKVLQEDSGPKFGPSEEEFKYYLNRFQSEYEWINKEFGFCFEQRKVNIYSNQEISSIINDDLSKNIFDFYINAKI